MASQIRLKRTVQSTAPVPTTSRATPGATSQFSLSSPCKGFATQKSVTLPLSPGDPWGSLSPIGTPTTRKQHSHLKVFLKPPHLLTPSAVMTSSTPSSTPPSATPDPLAHPSATPDPLAHDSPSNSSATPVWSGQPGRTSPVPPHLLFTQVNTI